jgi:hypothetical protein
VDVLVQVLIAKVQEFLQKKKCKHCWWVLRWLAHKKEHGSGTELLRELAGKKDECSH